MPDQLCFLARTQDLVRDGQTRNHWLTDERKTALDPRRTALLLCDVWDTHTSRGAAARLEAMIPRMEEVVTRLRGMGVLIIHSPSDVVDFYADHPARRRVTACPQLDPPADLERPDPPLPIPNQGLLSDTVDAWKRGDPFPWTRQHAGITMEDGDAVSARGPEVYSLMRHENASHLIMMGVHTNCCILHRTFGIKQMVRWGVPVFLVRDLTDAMYNPADPPYVSHDEGTQLAVGYIEKFWCPTLVSGDLLQ
jgi:nicotinamidase-related amidase